MSQYDRNYYQNSQLDHLYYFFQVCLKSLYCEIVHRRTEHCNSYYPDDNNRYQHTSMISKQEWLLLRNQNYHRVVRTLYWRGVLSFYTAVYLSESTSITAVIWWWLFLRHRSLFCRIILLCDSRFFCVVDQKKWRISSTKISPHQSKTRRRENSILYPRKRISHPIVSIERNIHILFIKWQVMVWIQQS